jgi:hypothetical protein
MTLTDDQATQLLERLAGTVPESPAPLERLVASGRRRRTRRRRLSTLGIGSLAAVLAVTTVGTVHLARDDREPPLPVAEHVAPPVPPPGTRYVGRGRMVVAVPTSWTTFTKAVCVQPRADFVRFEPIHTDYRCPFVVGPRQLHLTGVTIGSAELGPKASYGVRCLTSRPPRCRANLQVPDEDVTFALEGYANESPDVLKAVAASVTTLPDGWTTVPYVETKNRGFPTFTDVERALRAAGLRVEVANPELLGTANGKPWVETTVPATGEVVAEGGTVSVTLSVSAY